MTLYQELVLSNFIRKATFLTFFTRGARVIENKHFVAIDSGFPSDTFNVLVPLSPLPAAMETTVKETIDSFANKGFPLSIWVDRRFLTNDTVTWLDDAGMNEAERNITMKLDHDYIKYNAPLSAGVLDIKEVKDQKDVFLYGEVFQSLFEGTPEQAVLQLFFKNVAANYQPSQKKMRWFVGFFRGQAVSTGCVIEADNSYGIYDVMTRKEFRGRGFGSVMFDFLLSQIKTEKNGKPCVLQASQDGLNIYKRAGFEEVGEMIVWQ
ncbi:GNAT family N-acetyltransferase [Brevibacillus sp. B_LB10_24]|uniref:GNAT family N-acetyltransferase n=1 Tax=Brevibacillus sp. B_LB10_24 TaxID=3380645 RepID=UPI0038BAB3DF